MLVEYCVAVCGLVYQRAEFQHTIVARWIHSVLKPHRREKSLSKRHIIQVENRYLPGNCGPSHRDDRMTGICHWTERGRAAVLINISSFFFSLFAKLRNNDKQRGTLRMLKTAISGRKLLVSILNTNICF